MITLDENATSIEPTTHRYQYTRPTPCAAAAAAPAPGGPPAVGAAPGQHMDTSDAAAPGAPAGAPRPGAGFGSQTAIGGMPRSAIPGLGGAIGGYQPAAIPGLGGAPTGPGGVLQPAVAAAAAVAAPTMRQAAFRAPQQSAQPRAGALGGAGVGFAGAAGLIVFLGSLQGIGPGDGMLLLDGGGSCCRHCPVPQLPLPTAALQCHHCCCLLLLPPAAAAAVAVIC